jgi:DNA polymerase-1
MGVLDHVQLKYVSSFDDLCEFMRWIGERRSVLGVDTETGGFHAEQHRLRLAQFGDLNTGWAIPWEKWSGAVTEVIEMYDGQMVLHNSKFDARFISHHGNIKWPWHKTNDTMTMAHLLDPQRPKGLKPLSAMLIDPKAALAQRLLDDGMTDHRWTWDTVPLDYPYYWIYAAMDPVLTCHMYEKMWPQIRDQYAGVYDLEMGVTRVIAGMEARGARVNLEYCVRTTDQLRTWAASARNWLSTEYGIHRMTDLELLKFFQANSVPMLRKMTSSGSRQALDKEVLSSIDHPVAKTVLQIRKAEKNVGPYFSNFIELADKNNRVHPNIWTMGTRTARMSITTPALQTLPRKDPTVRTAFVPSDDSVLITCDYDQIEARLTAHFSEDDGLIHAFDGPDDFFCTLASQIFGEPISKKDPRRSLTKNTIYGKIYGAGPPKMAQTAGVPLEVMEGVVRALDTTFPGILLLQRRIGAMARSRIARDGVASIKTPMGRRLVADDGKDYTLMNYLIQSHAAEILKKKIVELDTVIPGMMILPVHDELVFDVPRDGAEDVQRLIETTMADHTNYRVPITASSDLLTADWGQKYRT